MIDAEKVNRQKERILSTIRLRGPSLPVQIAKVLEVSPLFAAAFLSELKAENKLRVSNLRVGSSPLYFIPGQESSLENFTKYLNSREREAFELLKKETVLEDAKQSPVVRVALRAIKDFAISVKVRIDGESKLVWKYFSLEDSEIGNVLSKSLTPSEPEKVLEEEPVEEKLEKVEEKVVEPVEEEVVSAPIVVSEKVVSKHVVKKPVESDFSKNVKDYLSGKDVEVMKIFSEKKREFEARIRIDTLFGKQEYYLIAKEKKSATDNDLAIAWQKSQVERLPALVMTTGDLNKKAKEHLGNWSNLVKHEKLRF